MIFNKMDKRDRGFLDKYETLRLMEWVHFTMMCIDYEEGGMNMSP